MNKTLSLILSFLITSSAFAEITVTAVGECKKDRVLDEKDNVVHATFTLEVKQCNSEHIKQEYGEGLKAGPLVKTTYFNVDRYYLQFCNGLQNVGSGLSGNLANCGTTAETIFSCDGLNGWISKNAEVNAINSAKQECEEARKRELKKVVAGPCKS